LADFLSAVLFGGLFHITGFGGFFGSLYQYSSHILNLCSKNIKNIAEEKRVLL
jgi:hypothetical protein